MPQVSKHELSRKVENNINNILFYFFASIKNADEAREVLKEFFTPTEIEMLSKRLALINMIFQEDSFSEMLEELKVSPSTIMRISKVTDKGGYGDVQKLLLRCRTDF